MNIDELAKKIRTVSDGEQVQRLADLLIEWKSDHQTVEYLNETIERYIGNTWFETDDNHSKIYKMWSSFRDKAIFGIGGMTVNERLYWFGLFDEFDACQNQESKLRIYNKIMASP